MSNTPKWIYVAIIAMAVIILLFIPLIIFLFAHIK